MRSTLRNYLYVPVLAASTLFATHVAAASEGQCTIIRVVFEMEYKMLDSKFGLDHSAANDYMKDLIAGADEVFRRELGIGVEFVGALVRDAGEDYPINPNAKKDVLLKMFRDEWVGSNDDIVRDVAVLLSSWNEEGAGGLKGGLAYGGEICSQDNWSYAMCLSLNGSFPYPLVDQDPANRDITLFLHELAHVIGAKHTHELDTPVDNCGPLDDEENANDCSVLPGTIMSFCHMCPDGGPKLIKMYFCPENIQLIHDRLAYAPCLDRVPSTINATQDEATTLENTCVYIDALQNDHATCTLAEIDWVPTFSSQGGKVEISHNTGEFDRDRLLYYPPPGFTGEDKFVYFVTDTYGNQADGVVTVTVDPQTAERPDYLVLDASDNSIRRFHAVSHKPLGHVVVGNYSILVAPRSIAILPNGDILVGETANTKVGDYTLSWVLRFDGEDGVSKGVFFQDERLQKPEALEVGAVCVWILDGADGQIFRVDHEGKHTRLIVKPLEDVHAFDMVYDADNDKLWVSQLAHGAKELRAFDALDGTNLNVIDAAPYLNVPGALFVRADGILEVGDRQTGKVLCFDSATGTPAPFAIAAGNALAHEIGGAFEFCPGPDLPAASAAHALVATGGAFAVDDFSGNYKATIAHAWGDELVKPVAIAYRSVSPLIVPILGDLNNDGHVDRADLAGLLDRWGSADADGDLDRSGRVDGDDLAILLREWTGLRPRRS